MPEVFAPPPEIVAGFMAEEAEQALLKWNPIIWGAVKARGLFITGPLAMVGPTRGAQSIKEKILIILRKAVFDRFGCR